MAKSRDIADSADVINILDSGGNLNTFATTFTLPSVDGTANQVLATDGGGSLSFQTLNTFAPTFTLPSVDGTAGQVLATDGGGSLSFVSSGGGGGVSTGKAIAMAMIFGG